MSKVTVSKTELVKELAERNELSQRKVNALLDDFVDTIISEVAAGKKVQIIGFGNFEARDRAERAGRNPQTGEALTIPASKIPAFKAGKAFKEAVN